MVETEAEVRREITDVLIVEKKKSDRMLLYYRGTATGY